MDTRNLEEFRKKVGSYLRVVEKNQKALAKEYKRDPTELSKRLNGRVPISEYDISEIIKTLATWKAFSYQDDARELFRLMDINPDSVDWRRPPYRGLRSNEIHLEDLDNNKPLQGPLYGDRLEFPEIFIGREDDREWLRKRLISERVTSISALNGMGGIGKTALAGFVIHRLREEGFFLDGIAVQVCLNRLDAIEVIKGVISKFDPKHSRPETIEDGELVDVVHRLLDGKKVLIFLDNIEPALDIQRVVRVLLATPTTTILLTARQTLPSSIVPPAGSQHLDLLPFREALDLFAQPFKKKTAQEFASTDLDLVKKIVEMLDRHTLAIKVTSVYACQKHRSLRQLFEDLKKDPQKALTLPDAGVPAPVMNSLALSVDRLSTEARELFVGLAVFATTGFGRKAALSLCAALHPTLADREEPLDSLIDGALIEQSPNDDWPIQSDYERLRLHPLMQSLAMHYFQSWQPNKQSLASRAIAEHYIRYSSNKGIPDMIFENDHDNVIDALEWASAHNETQIVANLCLNMYKFWRDTGRTKEGLHFLPLGVDATSLLSSTTKKREHQSREAELLLAYGQVLRRVALLDETEQAFQKNLHICQELEDVEGEGIVLSYLGRVAQSRGRLKEAESYCRRALEIHRRVGNLQEIGVDLSSLGEIFQTRGQYEEARRLLEEALLIQRQVGHNIGQGISLCFLGINDQAQGQFEQAEKHLNAALLHNRKIKYRVYEGIAHRELGYLAFARGRLDEANSFYEKALQFANETLDRQSEVVLKARIATLYADQGKLQQAEELYLESISLGKQYQYIPRVADALTAFSDFLVIKRDKYNEGCSVLHEALQLYIQMDASHLENEVRDKIKEQGCNKRNSVNENESLR